MTVRRDVTWLLLASIVVIGAGIGLRNPWPADEPVYALIARDMLAHGQWLIPMAGGDYFQDKPPLFFWLVAIFDWLTGSLRAGFLLPSLLAGVGTVLLVHDLARRLWNRQAALAAAFTLLIAVQFTLQSRRAQLDAMLMFFTFLSLYCLCRQLLLGGGWRWAFAAGVAAGFGVLAKMVGFLSFFVLLPWAWAVWRGWPGVRFERPWYGWILAGAGLALVVGLWLLPLMYAASGDPGVARYVEELLVEQTVGRYATPWHHYKPWYYYLTVFIPLWLPLTLLLPWLVPAWWRALRASDAKVLLPLAFVVLYVGFFSLSGGKRDVYILAALPALALAAAPVLPGLFARRTVQWTLLLFLALLTALCAGGWLWLTLLQPLEGAELLAEGGVASGAPLLVIAAAGLVIALLARLRCAAQGVFAFFVAAWLVAGLWILPQMDARRSGSAFIAEVEVQADPARPLGLVEYRENFLWNLRRDTWNFGHRRFREGVQEVHDAAAWLAADPSRQLLVSGPSRALCFGEAAAKPVGKAGDFDWWIVSGAADPACVQQGDPARAILYKPVLPELLL